MNEDKEFWEIQEDLREMYRLENRLDEMKCRLLILLVGVTILVLVAIFLWG